MTTGQSIQKVVVETTAETERTMRTQKVPVNVYETSGASIDSNQARDNRSNGFYAGADTSGNTFQNDAASDSGMFDCRDDSHGAGTAGTANFWLNDHGETSLPPGICR